MPTNHFKWDFLLHLGFEIAAGVGDGLAVGCLRASGAVQSWRATVENLSSLPDAFVDNWAVWFVGDATRGVN